MADQVEIKLATADDAPAVLDFLRQAATETDAVLIPHLDQVTVDQERQNIEMINRFDDCVVMLAMLGDQPWLLGEHKTLADAYFIGIARWTRYHDVVDRRDYPNLQRLFDKLEADPAVIFAHAIEKQQPATSAGGFLGEVGLQQMLSKLPLAA